MDVREVYIIVNKMEHSKEYVESELKAEGYKHNFLFGNFKLLNTDKETFLKMADEVWCFGDCSNTYDYKLAVELGCDIWQMG